jgi:hypothetical protein
MLMALPLLSSCSTVIIPAGDPNYFPMTKGTSWKYEAHSEVSRHGENIATNDCIVECKVLDVYESAPFPAALFKGFPLEADVWTGCTNFNNKSLLVCIPGPQYHLLDPADAKRFNDANDFLLGLVSEDSLILDCPLIAGKRFGEFEQLTRIDYSYSWHVVSEEKLRIKGVKGISPWRKRVVYTIEYRTRPDFQSIVFTPGIGILEYIYHHNGTPCDVQLHLKEFTQPDPDKE